MNQEKVASFSKRLIRESKEKNKNGKICILTDVDGTIIKEASVKFDNTFIYAVQRIKERLQNNFLFIANTGRTPKDVMHTIKQSKPSINFFSKILGNNGATSEYANYRLNNKAKKRIIKKFLSLGGKIEDIRFVSKDDTFINDDVESIAYYQRKQLPNVKTRNIVNDLNKMDIAKITLTGDEKIINKLMKFINRRNKDFKCALSPGNSKYRIPSGGKTTRRLDITPEGCNKGAIAKEVAQKEGTPCFMVMGNDENDIPMFKAAIDTKGYIVLVENDNLKTTEKIRKIIETYSKR